MIFHQVNPGPGKSEGLVPAIVVRALVRMDGRIRIESELGSGSRFYVELLEV